MSKGPVKKTSVQTPPRADQTLDQRTVITLTEYVQKLGGLERAKQALEALNELQRAA